MRSRRGVSRKFSWCPPREGEPSTGAPFLDPVIWNLLRKDRLEPRRGVRGGQGKITGTPHGRSASPLILRRQCSKLPRNSPCNQARSQTFSGACSEKGAPQAEAGPDDRAIINPRIISARLGSDKFGSWDPFGPPREVRLGFDMGTRVLGVWGAGDFGRS